MSTLSNILDIAFTIFFIYLLYDFNKNLKVFKNWIKMIEENAEKQLQQEQELEVIKEELQKAIENKDYEKCSKLRHEIKELAKSPKNEC